MLVTNLSGRFFSTFVTSSIIILGGVVKIYYLKSYKDNEYNCDVKVPVPACRGRKSNLKMSDIEKYDYIPPFIQICSIFYMQRNKWHDPDFFNEEYYDIIT